MKCDLILDGDYILNKNVYALHKNNLLFGALEKSLEISTSSYRRWFPFSNIYFVSDSGEKSWRKKIYNDYKSKRKKNVDIDWDFVYGVYSSFKSSIKSCKVLQSPHIEGDDWISYLVNRSNSEGRSTIIVSNDYDIKQLILCGIDPFYINIMTNEVFNKQKLFLPKNYKFFINEFSKINNDDIFNLNDNSEFLELIKSFIERYQVHEVDNVESLFLKVISGDESDNITSVWSVTKNGKTRGIGEAGAKGIIKSYHEEFGDLTLEDADVYENIADLICEKKKLSKNNIDIIKKNIEDNMKLIYLNVDYFPTNIKKTIEDAFR